MPTCSRETCEVNYRLDTPRREAISYSAHADTARPCSADVPHYEAISPSPVNEVTRATRSTEVDSQRIDSADIARAPVTPVDASRPTIGPMIDDLSADEADSVRSFPGLKRDGLTNTSELCAQNDSAHEPDSANNDLVIPSIFPVISAADYNTDDEFSDIYRYAVTEELTGNTRKDKTILIMADRYVTDSDGLLYRIDVPRNKKLNKLKPIMRRLCVPRLFRHEIIKYIHEHIGHYAVQSLFHTLSARYYWKSLFSDANEYCRTCETCQRTKVNFSHRFAPLYPVAIPDTVGTKFAMDHKTLTRTTTEGNNAVLVLVECFSGFPHLIPVPDMTAETTARAIVRHIIPWWGTVSCIFSDKGPSFVSSLFGHINALLGIKQVTSAARCARSNGLAEATVKRLVEHLKIYSSDDVSLEQAIPMIEVALRASAHTRLHLSPYEIIFGRPMPLRVPGDPPQTPNDIDPDRVAYYRWLSTELQRLHTAVKEVREQQKVADKKCMIKHTMRLLRHGR